LVNRGILEPTADELHDLVHVQHLSYRQIAERYGVDFTAIPHWLDRHGIQKPNVWETRRKGRTPKLPAAEELRHRRAAGESAASIAASCGVHRRTIVNLCRQQGIPVDRDGWNGGKRYICRDGHEARSLYEQRVDNWLTEHGLIHKTEPRYPFDTRYKADFLVRDTYIEVWGVTNNPAYRERKAKKIHFCLANGLQLIQINHWQFAKGRRWWRPLERLLIEDDAAKLF
jgi:transposase